MSQPFAYEHQTARIPATSTQADPEHYPKTAYPVLTASKLINRFSVRVSAAWISFTNGCARLVTRLRVLTATIGNLCLKEQSPITFRKWPMWTLNNRARSIWDH